MPEPGRSWRRSASRPLDLTHEALHDIQLDEDMENQQPRQNSRPVCFKTAAHEIMFIAVTCFVGATFPLVQRASVIVTGPIGTDLDLSDAEITWITASSGLTAGAFLLPLAYVLQKSTRLSPKVFLLFSLALYCLLAGAASIAQSGVYLDFILALMGVLCAVHVPIAVSLLASVYPSPGRRRNFAFAFFLVSSNPVAVVFGGVGVGTAAKELGWRTAFIFLAVVLVVVCVLTVFAVPVLPPPAQGPVVVDDLAFAWRTNDPIGAVSRKNLVGRFDWVGAVLLVAGVTLLSVGLTIAPDSPAGWEKTPYIWLMVGIGLLCLGCMLVWQNVTANPMIPMVIWRDRNLVLVIVFNALTSMGSLAVIFWLPLFMQTVQGLPPLDTAARMIPQAVVGLCVSPLIGLVIHRISNTLILATSAILQVCGCLPLLLLRAQSNYFAFVVPSLVLNTLSVDLSLNVAVQYVFSALPLEQHATGVAIVQTMIRLTIPLGLAATTAVHSSFDERPDNAYPELPFTNTFFVLLATGVFCLALVPFIRIPKTGGFASSADGSICVTVHLRDPTTAPAECKSVLEATATDPRRPRNLSTCRAQIQPRSSSLVGSQWRAQPRANATLITTPGATAGPPLLGRDGRRPNLITTSTPRSSPATAERVIWLVCEECGASRRIVEPVGDPARYFYDDGAGPETAGSEPKPRASLALGLSESEDAGLLLRRTRENRRRTAESCSSLETTLRRFPLVGRSAGGSGSRG